MFNSPELLILMTDENVLITSESVMNGFPDCNGYVLPCKS